jgi:hypothetical protein
MRRVEVREARTVNAQQGGARKETIVRIGTFAVAIAGAVWGFIGDNFTVVQRAGLLAGSVAVAGLAALYQDDILRHVGRLGHKLEARRKAVAGTLGVLLLASIGVVIVGASVGATGSPAKTTGASASASTIAAPSATSSGSASNPASGSESATDKKITWTASHYMDDCSAFVLPKALSEFGAAPTSEQLGDWARARGAATAENFGPKTGGTERIMLTLQGTSARPVTITELTFQAVDRKPALKGPEVSNECGDETVARYAQIDLDRNPPAITGSSADKISLGDARAEPIKFPYLVSATDPETLLLIASTQNLVAWHARLSWSDGETSGVAVIDDHGKPFLTSDPQAATSSHLPDGSGGWA